MRYRISAIGGASVCPVRQNTCIRVPRINVIIILFLISCIVASCGQPDAGTPSVTQSEIRVDLEKSDERRLLAFYIGGMVSDAGSNPFESGFVLERNGSYFLDTARLSELVPGLASDFRTAGADGKIVWDEFESLIQKHYYSYRPIPATVADLKERRGDYSDADTWFSFEVKGVMSPHVRNIHVSRERLLTAISNYRSNEGRLIYDAGTTFISEHKEDGQSVELSAMTKRSDGFWDFYAYGRDGNQISRIERSPSDLIIPTRCVGCHFGNRLFEPERSFPVDPAPGPDGPRKLYVTGDMRNLRVVRSIDEHRKRSDTILGLYATLYISRMNARRAEGTIDPEVDRLLVAAGF